MEKMFKVKSGAIIKIVPENTLQWYILARYKILGEVTKNDKTNTKKNVSK